MTFGFPKLLLPTIVCQQDAQLLRLEEEEVTSTHVWKGKLLCTVCEAIYPIEDGVLNLLGGQQQLSELMESEIASRDVEAAKYNEKLKTRYAKEVPTTLRALGDTQDKMIIEYGSGTGRFTQRIAADARGVLAIDFSKASLVWAQNNLHLENVGFVLADAAQIITATEVFDAALSTQVLEHFPQQEQREAFVDHINTTLLPGGRMVCTAYHHDLRRAKQPQEGRHGSGVFYHYFTREEIVVLFSAAFPSVRVSLIDITLPGEVRLGLAKYFGGVISRVSQHIPGLNRYAHLVMAVAHK